MNQGGESAYSAVIGNLQQEMILRNFSHRTIKIYLYYITDFLKFANKSPRSVTGADVKVYLANLGVNNASAASMNTVYSALKFYFGNYLHRNFFANIPRAKKAKQLPHILSIIQIAKMIEQANNLKHKYPCRQIACGGVVLNK